MFCVHSCQDFPPPRQLSCAASLCQLQLCTPVANPLSTESTSTESKMHFRLHYQLNFDWKVESLEVLYANEIILRGSAPGSGTENSCKSKCDCKLLSHLLRLSSSTLWLHIQQLTNVNCEANCTFPSLFSFKQLAIVLARAVATSGRKQGLVYIICLTAAAKKTLLQGGGGIPASFYLQHMQVQVPASQHLSSAHAGDILWNPNFVEHFRRWKVSREQLQWKLLNGTSVKFTLCKAHLYGL